MEAKMQKSKLPNGWKEVDIQDKKSNLIKLKIKIIKNQKKNFIAKASNFGVFGLGNICVDRFFLNFPRTIANNSASVKTPAPYFLSLAAGLS